MIVHHGEHTFIDTDGGMGGGTIIIILPEVISLLIQGRNALLSNKLVRYYKDYFATVWKQQTSYISLVCQSTKEESNLSDQCNVNS